jgi:hypothetical protein
MRVGGPYFSANCQNEEIGADSSCRLASLKTSSNIFFFIDAVERVRQHVVPKWAPLMLEHVIFVIARSRFKGIVSRDSVSTETIGI